MPDIRLPNGKIVRGVPDDMNKFTFMEMAIKNGAATPEDFGQESSSPGVEGTGFREGIGRGMTSIARGAGNMVGLIPDEEAKESNRLDQPLLDTTGGAVGNVVGQVAATAPIGGALGGAAKALTAVRGAAPAAQVLTRALANPLGRGAIEGGITGALTAAPDDQGASTLEGAALGGTLGTAGKILGATVRKLTPGITPEAKKLQELTGTFIPLSQALKPGIAKQFYEAFLANLPGVGGKVRGQYKNALEDLRRYAGEQAHPPRANVHITEKDSIQDVFGKLEDYWKTAYDDVGAVDMKLFTTAGGRTPFYVPDAVKEAMERVSQGKFRVPVAGQKVPGTTLVDLRRAANELLENIPEESVLKGGTRKELNEFVDHIDDTIKQNLDPSGKGKGQMAQIYKDYLEKNEYYDTYQTLQSAGMKALANQEFTPAQLAAAAAKKAGRSSLRGGTPDSLQEAGRLGQKALPDFPSRQGLFQTVAALGLGGAALGGVGIPAAVGAGALVGAGRGFANESVQKLLSGQKGMVKKYASLLRRFGRGGRAATVAGANDAKE